MRRKGIGRDLVLSALKQAEAWKATRITLCVAEQNRAAISLYESMGWIVIDRMMAFPAKPPKADEPAVIPARAIKESRRAGENGLRSPARLRASSKRLFCNHMCQSRET